MDPEVIVMQIRDEFMRGELESSVVEIIRNRNPVFLRDWEKMKLSLKLKLRQFRKKISDNFRAGLRKADGCRRYRPGKQSSTNKKEVKGMQKLRTQFARSGCDVLIEFQNLVDEVKSGFGGGKK
jgi:hypothetical protein